jgi:hypothetical protein
MKPGQFVEESFTIPEKLETEEFRLRMLTVNDVVKDYDAVISSIDELKTIWPDSGWPKDLTLEENLIDLGWHQREFLTRRSFAYTVVSLDETRVLGCVYINPTRKCGYDAEIYLWTRETKLGTGLDSSLYDVVKLWLKSEWPFKNVAFPGREINWDIWDAIPDEKR